MPRKSKKIRKAPRKSNSLIANIKNKIRGSRNPISMLQQVRRSCPVHFFPELIKWCQQVPHKNGPIFGECFPSNPGLLKNVHPIGFETLDIEMRWASARLLLHKERIEVFVELSIELEEAILIGDQGSAESIFEQIEKEYGYSFWLIENRIAYLQEFKGLEAQKKYTENIVTSYPSTFAAHVAHYVSQRNEKSVTVFRFRSRYQQFLKNIDHSTDLTPYLNYRIVEDSDGDEYGDVCVISHESTSSIIDLYEAYIWVCARAVYELCEGSASTLVSSVEYLSGFKDTRIKKMTLILLGDTSNLGEFPALNLLHNNYFLEGNHASAISDSKNNYQLNPLEVESIIGYAESSACMNLVAPIHDDGLSGRVSCDLSSLYLEGEDSYRAATDLMKTASNFRYFRSAPLIETYAYEMLSEVKPIVGGHLIYDAIFSPYCDPKHAIVLPITIRAEYLEHCESVYGKQLYIDWIKYIALDQSHCANLSDDCLISGGILNAALNSNASEVCRIFESNESLSNIPYYSSITKLYCFALVEEKRIKDAIEYMAVLCIKGGFAKNGLPLMKLLDDVDWKTLRPLSNKISTSVILNVCSRLTGNSEIESYLRYAHEEFLWSRNVTRPSELKKCYSDIDINQLIYFLRYVCVPSIMDVSSEYLSSSDVDRERLNICVFLSEIDEKSEEAYREEIHSLTTKLKVNEGLDYLDKTKMFVNEEHLIAWANKELKETFERYKAFLFAGLGEGRTGFTEAVSDYVKNGQPMPEEFLTLPKNESVSIFLDLIDSLKNEFLKNSEFGLDHYLSMRIRHGTLLGVLRGPLESCQIILQKKPSTGEYVRSEYWRTRCPGVDEDAIHEILANFSEFYDALLNKTLQELLQIKSIDKPGGLFDVQITAIVFHSLNEILYERNDFDYFVKESLSTLWQLLEPSLKAAREYFQVEIKENIECEMQRLDSELSERLSNNTYRTLTDTLRLAGTQMQSSLDQVAGWFDEPSEVSTAKFSIDLVVEIALETIRPMRAGFDPKVTRELDDEIHLQSQTVPVICDVLYIIFDNISKHSGMGLSPSVKLNIFLNNNMDLVIHSINDICPSIRNTEKLKLIEEKITTGDYKSALALEGGTGLIKIKRIVDPENRREGCLKFGFTDNDKFEIIAVLSTFEV